MLAYTVIATLPDEAVRSEYIRWLRDGHLEAVMAGGALSAQIVTLEDPPAPLQVETRYTFASRAVFEAYLRDVAPALRADGLRLFGPARRVTFERRFGMITGELLREERAPRPRVR